MARAVFRFFANTDPMLILWLHRTFGGNVRAAKTRTSTGKPVFGWGVGAIKAEKILSNCMPYFVMKKNQAELALSVRALSRAAERTGQTRRKYNESTVLDVLKLKTSLHVLKKKVWDADVLAVSESFSN